MTDALDEVIETNAGGPAKVSGDSGSVDQHSLSEQIGADKYLATRRAMASNPNRGLRFNKISPPGTA